MTRRVLIVDDDPAIRFFQRFSFEEHGAECEEAACGAEALAWLLGPETFSCVVLDQRMPDLTGLEVAARVRAAGNRVPIVLYSAYIQPAVAGEAASLGLTPVGKDDVDRLVAVVCGAEVGGAGLEPATSTL